MCDSLSAIWHCILKDDLSDSELKIVIDAYYSIWNKSDKPQDMTEIEFFETKYRVHSSFTYLKLQKREHFFDLGHV